MTEAGSLSELARLLGGTCSFLLFMPNSDETHPFRGNVLAATTSFFTYKLTEFRAMFWGKPGVSLSV